MVMRQGRQGGRQEHPQSPLAKLLAEATGLPPPEQLIAHFQLFTAELHRLNNNIEGLAPHIQTLAGSDLRGLSQALRDLNLPEAVKLGRDIYTRLWGK